MNNDNDNDNADPGTREPRRTIKRSEPGTERRETP